MATVDRSLTLFVRRRRLFCVGLAIGVGCLQATPELFGDEAFASIALRAGLWMVETVVLIELLSLLFDRAVERHAGPTRVLLVSLVVAAAIGALLAIGFVSLFQGVLGLELDEAGALPYPLAAGFGAIGGVLLAGVWAIAFVSPHVTAQAQRRDLETQALRFEAERLRASSELAHLRSQLEPHFLLNTLNTIAGLVTQRPREARRLLGCLGDLLRDSLRGEDEMPTLAEEITWLQRYAEILESRHGDALRFEWEVDAAVTAIQVPRLLLQPLVENAVQHGALRRGGGGRVTVRATLQETDAARTLVCAVRDNGPGLPSDPPRPGGLGLHTVRRRLALRCPGSAFHLRSSGEGTQAIIELPIGAA